MPKKKPGTYTAKNGARYKILANGKARFISGPTKRKGGALKGKKGAGLKTGGSMTAGGNVSAGGSMTRKYNY